MMSGQFFRKIYLSLYWKGCVCEGVGDWTKTATYWPTNSSGYHSHSFPFSWVAQPGACGPASLLRRGSHSSIFSPIDLNFLSPGLYNNLTSTYFLRASQFAINSTPRQSRSSLIYSTGCTCYLHRCISSFDSLAGSEVNMQRYVIERFVSITE